MGRVCRSLWSKRYRVGYKVYSCIGGYKACEREERFKVKGILGWYRVGMVYRLWVMDEVEQSGIGAKLLALWRVP